MSWKRRQGVAWWTAVGFWLAAPALALEPTWALSQYRIDTWSQRQGLPQASVLAILQDQAGYLWLGTQEGVARFDGVDFDSFSVDGTPELGQNFVNALALDVTGRLWFGTDGGTLATYSQGRFSAFATGAEFRGRVVGIHADASGGVYVAFHQSGLFRVVDERLTTVTLEDGGGPSSAGALATGPSGLWLGTEGGVYRQQGATWAFVPLPGVDGRLITALAPSGDSSAWVASGTNQLLEVTLDPGGASLKRPAVELPATVRSLTVDSHNVLWVATEDGLFRWRPWAGERSPQRLAKGPEGIVDTVREDDQGGLWIGTRSNGLYRLRSDEIMPFGTPEGLPDDTAWNVFESPEGALYVSTNGGLVRIENGQVETLDSPLFPTSDTVALAAGRDGSLLVGTFRHGLFQHSGGSQPWRRINLDSSLPQSPITAVHEDRRGRLWVGSRDGLARRTAGRFTALPLLDGAAQPYISSIVEEPSGTLWVATYGAGLFAFDDDAVRQFEYPQDLPSNQLNALHLDRQGRLWIATNDRGLAVLEGGHFGQVSTSQGLPYALVMWLVEDPTGHLWMSTNHGLVRVATEALAQVAFGAIPKLDMQLLTESDGIRDLGFSGTGQPAGWCTRDGRLWFPSGRGLAVGDPARFTENPPPRAAIRRLAVDGQVQILSSEKAVLALRAGRRELNFLLTAPDFDEPEGVVFRYRLLGFDDRWRDGGSERSLRYTNLPPGRYRFETAARHQDGGPFGPAAALDFDLPPTLLQSWPFRISLAVFAALLAVTAVRWRNRRLRALVARSTVELSRANQELETAAARELAARQLAEAARAEAENAATAKSDFLSTVSHELRTPLNAILGLSELLLDTPLDARQRQWQRLVQKGGADLLAIVDELLDLSRIEHDRLELVVQPFDLAQCLQTAISMATLSAAEKGLSLHFEQSPRELPPAVGDERRVRQVLNNLLANAIKFTTHGEVRVTAKVVEQGPKLELCLEVQDTGPGVPADLQSAIFQPFVQAEAPLTRRFGGVGLGLAIVNRLCLAMNGRIEVESTDGVGAIFRALMVLDRGTTPTTELGGDQDPKRPSETLVGGQEPKRPPETQADEQVSATPLDPPPAILAVEDDEVNRLVVGAILEKMGFECDFAIDGETALEAVATRPYDVVLLDLQLPGIDGFEVATRIRQGAAVGQPRIIALTASAMRRERDRSRAVGMDGFLSKPLRGEELAEVLHRLRQGQS